MAVTWSGCTGSTYPGQGQCMPDLNTLSEDFANHTARINGNYGTSSSGTTACNLGIAPIGSKCTAIQYVDANAFTTPQNISTGTSAQYLIGNAPRTKALHLSNPGTQDLDASVRRTFPLHFEHAEFVFEADCINVWNKVTFNSPSSSWSSGSTSFGTISGVSSNPGPRDWQFAGHINF
jgi:hypothetical protein